MKASHLIREPTGVSGHFVRCLYPVGRRRFLQCSRRSRLDGCRVADGLVSALVLSQRNPPPRVVFHVLDVAPGALGADQFGAVGADL